MIQRIQTIYLLLISALMVTMLFVPYANVSSTANGETTACIFEATGIWTLAEQPVLLTPTWSLFTLVVITAILPLITIFLYKKRLLQIRFCIFNGILMVLFYGLFFFYWWLLRDEYAFTFGIALTAPLVTILLNYMSFRKIAQDEMLIRSLDRIR